MTIKITPDQLNINVEIEGRVFSDRSYRIFAGQLQMPETGSTEDDFREYPILNAKRLGHQIDMGIYELSLMGCELSQLNERLNSFTPEQRENYDKNGWR